MAHHVEWMLVGKPVNRSHGILTGIQFLSKSVRYVNVVRCENIELKR